MIVPVGTGESALASADCTGERSLIWEAEFQVAIAAGSTRIAYNHKMHPKMRANSSRQYPEWGSSLVAAAVPNPVNPSRDPSHRLVNSHRVSAHAAVKAQSTGPELRRNIADKLR